VNPSETIKVKPLRVGMSSVMLNRLPAPPAKPVESRQVNTGRNRDGSRLGRARYKAVASGGEARHGRARHGQVR